MASSEDLLYTLLAAGNLHAELETLEGVVAVTTVGVKVEAVVAGGEIERRRVEKTVEGIRERFPGVPIELRIRIK